MKGEYTIDIARPREDVFEFLEKIVPNLVDHGVIEEKPEKVGTTFWQVYEEKGRKMKMTGVVTEHQPPERLAVELDGAMFGLDVAYRLEEIDATNTRLIQESDARFKHIFKILGLLFGKKMKAEGEKVQAENFGRMKRLLEEGTE